jgi:predicted MFS family arabinose efflux permease
VCAHAMAAFSIGTACCALWPSLTAILTLRALTGAAAAGLIPLTLAYIGDTVPYAQRQATIVTLMAAAGAAQALSTSAGGSIATLLSWRAVFPCLGGLAGLATLGLYSLKHRAVRAVVHAGARPSYWQVLTATGMPQLLSLVALEGFLFSGAFTYLSALLEERFAMTAFPIGLLLGLTGLAQLTAARVLPRLAARERRLLSVGGTTMGAAYLLVAIAPHWSLIALACCMLGAGFISCHSTLQTRATEIFPTARGTAVACFAFSLFMGSGLGTALFGFALDAIGLTRAFALTGFALLVFTSVVVRVIGASAGSREPSANAG